MLKNKKIKISLIIVLASILILGLRSWYHSRIRLETAARGELEISKRIEGTLIRNEAVFRAKNSGNVNFSHSRGERIPYGEEVALLENNSNEIPVFARRSGILSFSFDGLEEKLDIDSVPSMSEEGLKNIESDYTHRSAGQFVESDERLYRITENTEIYVLIFPEDDRGNLSENSRVILSEPDSPAEYEASVKKSAERSDADFLILKVDNFPRNWNERRNIDLELIKEVYRGILLPEGAVFSTPEGRGVLIYDFDESYSFREVSVLGTGDKMTVVEGVDAGEQVIINPESVNYGRR